MSGSIRQSLFLTQLCDMVKNPELSAGGSKKKATVDNGVNKELDVNNIVVAKGLVAAEGTSREDGMCFVDDVDDGVDEDNVVSSLRPSKFSQLVTL
jgi:hypothetical protein